MVDSVSSSNNQGQTPNNIPEKANHPETTENKEKEGAKGRKASMEGEGDIIMVEGEPETAPVPHPQVGLGLHLGAMMSLPPMPSGTLISLPGLPTVGPPPRSYGPPMGYGGPGQHP